MERVDVFVPNPMRETGIAPGSGIVGGPGPIPGRWLMVDFEGNLYGAVNLVRYADRVRHAYDRQSTQYPTIARRMLHETDLIKIGEYDPRELRVVLGENAPMDKRDCQLRLMTWLPQESVDLEEELVCT